MGTGLAEDAGEAAADEAIETDDDERLLGEGPRGELDDTTNGEGLLIGIMAELGETAGDEAAELLPPKLLESGEDLALAGELETVADENGELPGDDDARELGDAKLLLC